MNEQELLQEALDVAEARLRETWSPAARAAALIARRKKHGGLWGRNLARALGGGGKKSPGSGGLVRDAIRARATPMDLVRVNRAYKRAQRARPEVYAKKVTPARAKKPAAKKAARGVSAADRAELSRQGYRERPDGGWVHPDSPNSVKWPAGSPGPAWLNREIKHQRRVDAAQRAKKPAAGRAKSPRPTPAKSAKPTMAARARKLGITMRQEGGDDGYQYVVRHGSKEITGLTKREAVHYRDKFVKAAEKKRRAS